MTEKNSPSTESSKSLDEKSQELMDLRQAVTSYQLIESNRNEGIYRTSLLANLSQVTEVLNLISERLKTLNQILVLAHKLEDNVKK